MTDAQIACLDGSDQKAKLAAEFEIIWDIYPKRVKQEESRACYRARRKEGVPFRTLYAAVVVYKRERRGEDAKYTMGGDAFFGTNHRYKDYDGKANGETQRKDGKWAPKMTRDLPAMARRDAEEKASLQKTPEEPTTDPSPTTESIEDRMKNL